MRVIFIYILLLSSGSVMAQYEADRHSTNWFDGWISCEETPSPNEKWGDRHWIKYDFDTIYTLQEMTFWNFNDNENNTLGVRDVIIDYSLDGTTWTEWGLYTFEKAPATGFYHGVSGPDFDDLQVKHMLLTVLSNHGGGSCSGFGELKIKVKKANPIATEKVQEASFGIELGPNPTENYSYLSMTLDNLDPTKITMIDGQGKVVKTWTYTPSTLKSKYRLDLDDTSAGVYYIHVQQKNKVAHQKLTIVK